jgi:hypothetical protein
MSEELPAREKLVAHALSPKIKPTEITVVERIEFKAGGRDDKSHVLGEVGPARVSLIERPYSPAYVEVWPIMKNAKLPVVPTLRTVQKNGESGNDVNDLTLLVTDVKRDGSEVYGKGYFRSLFEPLTWSSYRRRPAIDEKFLEIMETQKADVLKKAREYADRATRYNIVLPRDDPLEMIVHPDGSWDFMILDLEMARVQRKDISLSQRSGRFFNQSYVSSYWDQLEGIEHGLKQRNKTS